MSDASALQDRMTALSALSDFTLGQVTVSPSARTVNGPAGVQRLEPRALQVLVLLANAAGRVVTRQRLFEACWGSTVVGDDSLNRVIVSLRKVASEVGAPSFSILTVSGVGYRLERDAPNTVDLAADAAVREGHASWRLALPTPDWPAIARLRTAAEASPGRADTWGALALLLRVAAEYAETDDCAAAVAECQSSAARALALDPAQPDASVALASLAPLFGDWLAARGRLLKITAAAPSNAPASHDLAVLEMATGRPSAAVPLIKGLIEADPLAAIYHYKRAYHLWTLGDVGEMDRVADRAMQLWPRHPAIWHCRLWTLAFTGRARFSLAMVEDDASRPPIPPPAAAMLRATMASLEAGVRGGPVHAEVVAANLAAARRGPAQSVAAIMHLAGLGALDAAFEVANGYLARRGPFVAPIGHTAEDPSVNEQHRRVTQMLFLPVTAPMRADPRFGDLCEAIGLADYWRRSGLTPDFAG